MSGWVAPPAPNGSPGPVVGWVAVDEPEGLGVREAAREGWRLVRAHRGTFAAIAAVPMILLNLLTLPIWVSTGRMFEQAIRFWATLDIARYRNDPDALQRDWQAAMQPSTELAVVGTIGVGLALIVSMLGVAAITAATVDAGAGRRPSFTSAYRAVATHLRALILPALAIGVGYIVIFGPLTLSQNDIVYGSAAAGQAALSVVLGLAALVLEIVALYLAIRWSLYFQVVVAEDVGFRRALARSAELTSGVRIRVGLIVIVWSIVVGIVVSLVALTAGLVVGLAAASLAAGLVAYTISLSLCGLVYLPLFVAILTHVYRQRVEPLAVESTASA